MSKLEIREIELEVMKHDNFNVPEVITSQPDQPEQRNKLKEQIKIFALCYFCYCFIHVYREFWSMSKKSILNQDSNINETMLSDFDTVYLFTYSICTFIGGVVGDMMDLRKLLALSF